jgi:hypothetical protein
LGKGLVWGSVVLLLFLLAVVGYFVFGRTAANIGWIVIRVPVGGALIAGIRRAWTARTIGPEADYAEVFE